MSRTLYELNTAFNNIMDLALDDTMDLNVLENALQSIEGELAVKCKNGIGLLKNLDMYIEGYKAEIKRLEACQKALENRAKRIKDLYVASLDAMGKDRVTTELGTMRIQANGGKAPLKIDDESQLPASFLTVIPEHYEPNKTAIYDALNAGQTVPGAHLEPRGRHLRIA